MVVSQIIAAANSCALATYFDADVILLGAAQSFKHVRKLCCNFTRDN